MYGGRDTEWVRKFMREAHRVSIVARIPLKMVYVGKSNIGEQVKCVLGAINLEKLQTHNWKVQTMTWFF